MRLCLRRAAVLGLLASAPAHAAAPAVPPPTVTLAPSRRGTSATLVVTAPPGHHVAADAPLAAELQLGPLPWSAQTLGATAPGLVLPLPDLRPLPVSGTLALSICTDDNRICQPMEQQLQGVLDSRRDAVVLDGVAPAPPAAAPHADDLDAALAEAQATGRRVLLDFGAIWCPPCNLMAAELLHDPDDAALFEGLVLVEVDVDDPTSFPLKSRYAVGGYPTLVAVDAEGAVIDRLVGYPGESETADWIGALDAVTPLSAAPPPETLDPAAAGTWALRLLRAQQPGAAQPYLDRAKEMGELTGDALLARVLAVPTATGIRAAAAEGAPLGDWLWPALGMADAVPEVRALLDRELRAALPEADAVLAGDLFYALAQLDPDGGADHYLAGARVLASALTGDLARDRGHLGFLATLWARGGQVDEARRILDGALAAWPDDMTFHEDRARLELDHGAVETALEHAEIAVRKGYGDNRLRATALWAEALYRAGHADEAQALIADTLQRNPRPPEDLAVRTGRYLDALVALRDDPPAPAP